MSIKHLQLFLEHDIIFSLKLNELCSESLFNPIRRGGKRMLHFTKLERLQKKLIVIEQLLSIPEFSGVIAESVLNLIHICSIRVIVKPPLLTNR